MHNNWGDIPFVLQMGKLLKDSQNDRTKVQGPVYFTDFTALQFTNLFIIISSLSSFSPTLDIEPQKYPQQTYFNQ